ncbi:MAG: flagellar biosynthetic protein FliO [Ilumatobacter sp.]
MGDFGELVVRMLISLGIVLALVAVAYIVARRRQSGLTVGGQRRRQRTAVAPTLQVEGRAGLARGSSVVAVRFADRIVLVGVTDGAPTSVLSDVSAADWDREPEVPVSSAVAERAEALLAVAAADRPLRSVDAPVRTASGARTSLDLGDLTERRPGFLEALRDATTRRTA